MSTTRRLLLVLLCAFVGPGLAQDPVAIPAAQADPVVQARAKNLAVWRRQYRPQAAALAKEKVTGWVMIVEGMLLPVDGKGKVMPGTRWPDLVALAERLHPGAVHRFLFQVGEDGDQAHFYTMGEFPHGIGSGLVTAVRKATSSGWLSTPHQIWLKSKSNSESTIISEPDPKGIPYVPFSVGAPGGETKVSHAFGFASAFTGPAVVSEETARKLDLARYEIPGTMTLNRHAKCRRARARFVLKKAKADVVVGVAVWPKPAATKKFPPK
ncbi:MAG: hypothetical protein CMJ83_10105 [Planctomycetes bacterium]|nr:hypothetical protein [Planctomycetota bacterium]